MPTDAGFNIIAAGVVERIEETLCSLYRPSLDEQATGSF